MAVDGIDLFGVGPSDWSVGLGLFGPAAKEYLAPQVERIVKTVGEAGKTMVMIPSGADEARRYYDLGARTFRLGVDITLKRRAMFDAVSPYRDTFGG